MSRGRRYSYSDPLLSMLAGPAAEVIAAQLEEAGYPITMETYWRYAPRLTAAFTHLLTERVRGKVEARHAARATWAAENGLTARDELAVRLRLSEPEIRTAIALGLLTAVPVPDVLRETWALATGTYYPVPALDRAAREHIAAHTLLTKAEATERLGITPAVFDRRCKALGIERAGTTRGASGTLSTMYRLTDVERLEGF